MAAWRRSRWIWIAGIAAVLVGVYALVGFRVLPGIVRKQAIQFVRETYARELVIGAVRINPFLFQLEVRDVVFPDAGGKPMLGVKRFFADFELSSLWHRAYVFRDLAVDAPYIGAVLRPDGSMNLADLSPPHDPRQQQQPESPLPRLWIKALDVSDGHVDYLQNMRGSKPVQTVFTPITFSLQDFRTTPEGGDFRLNATGAGGAVVDWKGRFALAPAVNSEGDFSITNLAATRVAELLGDAVPFAISKGTIALGGHYRVALTTVTDLRLNLPAISVRDVGLGARGVEGDWIQIPDLKVEGVEVALPAQTLSIAAIALNDLKASGWLSADGTVSFVQMFASPMDAAPEVTATAVTPPAVPAKAPSSAPWKVSVAAVNVNAAALAIEDRMIAPGTPWKVAPLNLQVKNVSLDLSRAVQVAMDATINDNAQLKIAGNLALDPMVADFDVALEKARMRIIQPYILPYADLTVSDGLLGASGKLRMAPPGRKEPQLSFAGDVTIDGFRSTDNTLHEDFVNFTRLQLQKLRYEKSPDAVHIDRVLVREPYARVIISREEILNISAVLDPRAAAAEARQKRLAEATLKSETMSQKRQREKQAAAAKKAAATARKKAGPAAPAQAPPPPDTLPVRIREVVIERGRMNFADLSVQPNFAANIQNLNGKVTGLSSAFESRAKVDLKGNLGEFEPVTIGGEIQPFAFDRFTDIGLKFENISLPLFNPYSGRFAGYNIAKGKLTTDLHYLIQDRKLDAKHHILIEQLEWGEATPTKGEATLPVKFATVLLRDRNGVINLDIPVTGSLDDPRLRIGPIVWQIFKNLIVKVVTAPFAMFGAMFKGAEDAQFVDFAPGSAQIDPAGIERLKALSKGLTERPSVALDVPIGTGTELDRPVLAKQHYEEQLAAATRATIGKGQGKDKAGAAASVPALDTLEPKQQIEVLTALVRHQGATVQIPEPPAPAEGTSRADARAIRDTATIEYLQKIAHDAVMVKEEELAELGQARAVSIQHALLADTGLEPARVFLTREGKVSTQDGKVRFELGLK